MPLGKEQYIQLGVEAANNWGSVVAATVQLEVMENTIELVSDKIDDPSLFSGFAHRAIIDAGNKAAGSLKFRSNYDGHLNLFRMILGGYTASPVETGVRDHIFTESDQRSATIRDYRGATLGTRHVPGFMPSKMEFEIAKKQLATLSFDGVGKDVIDGQGLTGSLSFPAVLPVQFNHLDSASVADGTGDSSPLQVTRMKCTINRPLDENFDLGSLTMQQPTPSDFCVAEYEIEYREKSLSAFQKLRAGTSGALLFKFQDPATIGATSKREIEFSSPSAKCVKFTDPVPGYNQFIATATWRAFYDAGISSSVKIRVRNTETALP